MPELRHVELSQVSLNHDYFAYIKEIAKAIGEAKLNRELYGFSLDNVSSEGVNFK